MNILQNLISHFPIGSSGGSLVNSDNQDEAICTLLRSLPVTAYPDNITTALNHLAEGMNNEGMSTEDVVRHILDKITPGLAAGQSGPRYFGFVTGGALPAAQCGDILATIYDQNVQVHLPNDTISTALEYRTLEMILDLLSIPRDRFKGRSLTTGATASNILGLACARDYATRKALDDPTYSVADNGVPAGVRIRVITDRHHASIEKAAAVVGIGRKNVVDLSATSTNASISFSERLESALGSYRSEDMKRGIRTGLVIVVGFAEVNTGDFTDMRGVRDTCDKYSAWLHIDAAFGALSCLLPEYSFISTELENADSITADAHKSFNTPYACGIFFTRSLNDLTSILAGSSIPAYLAAPPLSQSATAADENSAWVTSIPSPLHTNLENSRRFIALPLYCALLSMGRLGYSELMERNVRFSRALAEWMDGEEGGRWFECLNLREIAVTKDDDALRTERNVKAQTTVPLNVVLFRAKDVDAVPVAYRGSQPIGNVPETLTGESETDRNTKRSLANAALVRDINATKRIYVSPGGYPGGAVRIAVSNWMTDRNDGGTDLECVKEVLRGVMRGGNVGPVAPWSRNENQTNPAGPTLQTSELGSKSIIGGGACDTPEGAYRPPAVRWDEEVFKRGSLPLSAGSDRASQNQKLWDPQNFLKLKYRGLGIMLGMNVTNETDDMAQYQRAEINSQIDGWLVGFRGTKRCH